MTNGTDRMDVGGLTHLYTVRAVAEQLALSRSTLYNLMDQDDLGYVKIGRSRRIPIAEVDRLVRASLVNRRNAAAS